MGQVPLQRIEFLRRKYGNQFRDFSFFTLVLKIRKKYWDIPLQYNLLECFFDT